MKNFLFLLLVSATLFAQQETPAKMNIIKTNVSAFAFRNVNLTYERAFTQKFSVALGFGTVSEGSIPFSGSYIKGTEFENAEASLTTITLEPRIYFGQGFGQGFYLAPYYRFSSGRIDHIVVNENYGGQEVPVYISGNATAHSAGLMLGAQWLLGESRNWVLDVWFIGAHYGVSKGNLRGTSSRLLTPQEQQELKENIEGLDVPFVKYTTTTDANGATITVDGPWAGVRSGISFGYRF